MRDLIRLRRLLRHGRLKDPDKVLLHLGRLKERYQQAWRYVKINLEDLRLSWRWNRDELRLATSRDGAYLLRTNLVESDPAKLWSQYIQLTEVEAVIRDSKRSGHPSDLALHPQASRSPCHGRLKQIEPARYPGSCSINLPAFKWWKSGSSFALGAASAWNPSLSPKPLRPPSSINSTGPCPSSPRPESTRPRSKMCGQPKAP